MLATNVLPFVPVDGCERSLTVRLVESRINAKDCLSANVEISDLSIRLPVHSGLPEQIRRHDYRKRHGKCGGSLESKVDQGGNGSPGKRYTSFSSGESDGKSVSGMAGKVIRPKPRLQETDTCRAPTSRNGRPILSRPEPASRTPTEHYAIET